MLTSMMTDPALTSTSTFSEGTSALKAKLFYVARETVSPWRGCTVGTSAQGGRGQIGHDATVSSNWALGAPGG